MKAFVVLVGQPGSTPEDERMTGFHFSISPAQVVVERKARKFAGAELETVSNHTFDIAALTAPSGDRLFYCVPVAQGWKIEDALPFHEIQVQRDPEKPNRFTPGMLAQELGKRLPIQFRFDRTNGADRRAVVVYTSKSLSEEITISGASDIVFLQDQITVGDLNS